MLGCASCCLGHTCRTRPPPPPLALDTPQEAGLGSAGSRRNRGAAAAPVCAARRPSGAGDTAGESRSPARLAALSRPCILPCRAPLCNILTCLSVMEHGVLPASLSAGPQAGGGSPAAAAQARRHAGHPKPGLCLDRALPWRSPAGRCVRSEPQAGGGGAWRLMGQWEPRPIGGSRQASRLHVSVY